MDNYTFNSYVQHHKLEWICLKCALIDISYTALNNSESINGFAENEEPVQKTKPKNLKILTCNLNKKAELELILNSKDIDVVIGTETHLSCNISTSETVPPNYAAACKDRNDDHGGVIIMSSQT